MLSRLLRSRVPDKGCYGVEYLIKVVDGVEYLIKVVDGVEYLIKVVTE